MSFASVFLSAWLGGLARRGRMMLGMAGAIAAAGGAWQMVSATTHSMNGVSTLAVLVERSSQCQAEFQPKGESRRKVAMDCDRAHALREAAGSKKVRVHKKDCATVRYTLSDGTSRTATAYEGKVETRGLPIGGTFQAVYDPAAPDDVRAQPNLSSIGFNLAMLFGGLGALGLALLPQMLGLFGSRAPRPAARPEADMASWGEDALTEAIARKQKATVQASPSAPGSRPVRGPAVAGARRQFGVRAG
jgi:hypothetical protein